MSNDKDPVDPEVLKKLGRVVEAIPAERTSFYDTRFGGGGGIVKPYDPPKEYSFEISPKKG